MSLHPFFSILRARIGTVVLVMLLALALAAGWAKLRTPSYTARAPVLVDVRTDPVSGTPMQKRTLDYQNRASLPFGEAGIALGLLDVESSSA